MFVSLVYMYIIAWKVYFRKKKFKKMKVIILFIFSTRKEVEKCKNKKMKYDFAYYILVCKTYRQKGQKNSPLFYTNAEEEFLQEVYQLSI